MGIVIAAIIAIGGAIGLGVKEKTFKDTTHQDTVAFEKNALENQLALVQSKERNVVELQPGQADAAVAMNRSQSKEDKLTAKIQKLEELEKSKGWN